MFAELSRQLRGIGFRMRHEHSEPLFPRSRKKSGEEARTRPRSQRFRWGRPCKTRWAPAQRAWRQPRRRGWWGRCGAWLCRFGRSRWFGPVGILKHSKDLEQKSEVLGLLDLGCAVASFPQVGASHKSHLDFEHSGRGGATCRDSGLYGLTSHDSLQRFCKTFLSI